VAMVIAVLVTMATGFYICSIGNHSNNGTMIALLQIIIIIVIIIIIESTPLILASTLMGLVIFNVITHGT
jgi:hypothetical protein